MDRSMPHSGGFGERGKRLAAAVVLLSAAVCSLQAQAFVVPPAVDLLQYALPNTGGESVRMWGWSKDGKIAYSTESGDIDDAGNYRMNITFKVMDMVNDKNIFNFSIDTSFDEETRDKMAKLHPDGYDFSNDIYKSNRDRILNAFKEFNIITQETKFLPFPLKKDGITYDCRLTDMKYQKQKQAFDNVVQVVSKYSVLVTANGKSKIVSNFTASGDGWLPEAGNIHICGYVLSPFENRALIIVMRRYNLGFMDWNTSLDFIGCHLDRGFKEMPAPPPMETFVDSRDKKSYRKVKIGAQTWMAENLNYDIPGNDADVCYENSPDNCAKYGRLYDWNSAKSACPAGWRLPSNADWDKLVNFAGGRKKTAPDKLRAAAGWIEDNGTDEYGFSALPGGRYYFNPSGEFGNIGDSGMWWSATENTDIWAWSEHLVRRDNTDKRTRYSVRCVAE